ncbi:flagellar assembly factor FliW [Clostridium moniliforme]|uniref:Flagellar assembly factor FliW n=1 Tax=Clostridium moniliforme TaxID=39489 RepID=A0ABS4F1S8_9CLOT|nr:flagellar assembly protein FliW [Clostridium moniliforme]MBP1890042.1 flagellar assembly factor FliW [Clostridium moniliforme]
MKVVFEKGIPGFENINEFEIKDLENNNRFKIVESLDNEVSFATINPFEIYNEYEIDLNDETIKELQIENPKDVLILTIITLGKTLESSTINLKAPLVINIKNKLGRQFIIQGDKYNTKHPLVRRN